MSGGNGDTWVRYFAAAGDAPRDTLLGALELHEKNEVTLVRDTEQ